MKRRYWPSLAQRKEADEAAKQLTKAREDGSNFNEKPEFTPDGDKIAIFTDKSDYTEIVLIDALTGKRLETLTKAERSGDLESLHFFVSGLSFSPDGKSMVFAAKSKGKESLFFVDVRKKKIYRKERLDYYNVVNPVWSPDGKRIAFSALDTYKRDLFVFDLETSKIVQITDDRFDDNQPSWLPGNDGLVFSSDRPHPRNAVLDSEGHPTAEGKPAEKPGGFEYGLYNIFKVDLATRKVEPLDVGLGQNRLPRVSPDGKKVAFISTRNGIANLYIAYLDSTSCFAVTDILTDIHSFSWSPKGDKLAFSAFFRGGYDVFVLNDIKSQGEGGVLALTGYARGEYDHPGGPASPAEPTSSDTTKKVSAPQAAAPEGQVVPAVDSVATTAQDTTGISPVPSSGDSTVTTAQPQDSARVRVCFGCQRFGVKCRAHADY
jgi:Tol biopolymer transport system component